MTPGPYQAAAGRLHAELRANLVRTVTQQYVSTGFLWESYDSSTGKGKGTHPFTGWTSLVVLVLADDY